MSSMRAVVTMEAKVNKRAATIAKADTSNESTINHVLCFGSCFFAARRSHQAK